MATGKFAKDSNSALGTEDVDNESGGEMNGNGVSEMNGNGESDATGSPTNHGATSSASKAKKAKTSVDEEEGLIGAINRVGDKLACAIEKVATQPPPNDDLPEDLFDIVNSLPGFDSTDISIYYAYLVANPRMGRAFYKLPFEHKLNWLAMFVANKFPGQ